MTVDKSFDKLMEMLLLMSITSKIAEIHVFLIEDIKNIPVTALIFLKHTHLYKHIYRTIQAKLIGIFLVISERLFIEKIIKKSMCV